MTEHSICTRCSQPIHFDGEAWHHEEYVPHQAVPISPADVRAGGPASDANYPGLNNHGLICDRPLPEWAPRDHLLQALAASPGVAYTDWGDGSVEIKAYDGGLIIVYLDDQGRILEVHR